MREIIMKKNRLFILLSSLVLTLSFAQDNNGAGKAIYKWEAGGLVYYSHIKPDHVKNVTKLDSSGRKIEDYTEDFGEVVQIIVRPKNETSTTAGSTSIDAEKQLAESREQDIRTENCNKARKNLETINGGEVYERDSKGNLIRLTEEQIQNKRKNVERDVDYFCSE